MSCEGCKKRRVKMYAAIDNTRLEIFKKLYCKSCDFKDACDYSKYLSCTKKV